VPIIVPDPAGGVTPHISAKSSRLPVRAHGRDVDGFSHALNVPLSQACSQAHKAEQIVGSCVHPFRSSLRRSDSSQEGFPLLRSLRSFQYSFTFSRISIGMAVAFL
jgi:hypothetical protein